MSRAAPEERTEGTPRSELWLYFWAGVTYIAAGFPVKQVFAWWWFGAIWFVGFVWLVPPLLHRIRARRRDDIAVASDDTA